MKKFFLFILLVFLFTVIGIDSCTKLVTDSRLMEADSLMNISPLKAYEKLKLISIDSLDNNNRAYFALLYTQAQYKNVDIIKSDSLINIAIEYYSDNDDREKYTRALIYKGAALSDMGRDAEAMEWYKMAESNAAPTDYENLGCVNMRMAELYQMAYVDNETDIDKYKEALKYYRKAGIKRYQLGALGMIGGIYRRTNSDSACHYLYQAIILAKEIGSTEEYYNNIQMLSRTYLNKNQFEKANILALEALQSGIDFKNYEDCLYDACHSYAALGKIDSAQYYFNKIRKPESIKYQVLYYSVLSELEKSKGNLDKAFEYVKLSEKTADIQKYNRLHFKVGKSESTYDRERMKIMNKIIIHNRYTISVIMVITILIIIFSIIMIRKKRREVEDKISLIEKIQEESIKSHSELIEKIADESKFAESMRNQIEIMRNLISMSHHYGKTPKFVDEFHKAIKLNQPKMTFWTDLRFFVDKTYNNVISRIVELHPSLSQTDIDLLALMCCNFSYIEITLCMGYSHNSYVSVKRVRLEKKMKIDMRLDDYLEMMKNMS